MCSIFDHRYSKNLFNYIEILFQYRVARRAHFKLLDVIAKPLFEGSGDN